MLKLNVSLFLLIFLQISIDSSGNIPPPPIPRILIHKCCGKHQYILDNATQYHGLPQIRCQNATEDNQWVPTFKDESLKEVDVNDYSVVVGIPACQSRIPWRVDDFKGTCDKLILLKEGKLRHYAYNQDNPESCGDEIEKLESEHYDFSYSDYCIDKIVYDNKIIGQIAVVCLPKTEFPWNDWNATIRKILNPIFHILSIICLLIVAVIYFVLPQLSDLVGNIITTIAVCLITVQVANIIHIFAEFHSEMSYLIVDSVIHFGTLSAFFWLNSFGYYIWKTFRSRNVFLRITDGKKYCYYSIYAWGSTFGMSCLALFAHFIFDTATIRKEVKKITESTIGEIGIAVFFTTIATIILINTFFCLSTVQVINRMSTYGRIHYKLKYNFQLFVKLFIIMTFNWFFHTLARFPHNSLFYVYIVVNLSQSIAILYVTVIASRKVCFLLSKACCNGKCISSCCTPGDLDDGVDWGEEMMAMNISSY